MRNERVQREVDRAIAEGWKIESETPERVVLVRRNYGELVPHLLVAVLTFWWTMGLGNVAYGAYKYLEDSERRVLRKTGAACPECGEAVEPGANYCSACGTELSTVADGGVCSECGDHLTPGAKFCRTCGTEVGRAVTEE